jgi:cell division protein FtsW (lipid II flippase)
MPERGFFSRYFPLKILALGALLAVALGFVAVFSADLGASPATGQLLSHIFFVVCWLVLPVVGAIAVILSKRPLWMKVNWTIVIIVIAVIIVLAYGK